MAAPAMALPARDPPGTRRICSLVAPSDEWLALRRCLWPDCPDDEQRREMAELAGVPRRHAQFLARDERGAAVGLLEASLRHDFVNGTASSPVAFLEGVYVAPAQRRRGHARALVAALLDWARAQGCREVASDALADNAASHAFHRAIGFAETERVVFFRRALDG